MEWGAPVPYWGNAEGLAQNPVVDQPAVQVPGGLGDALRRWTGAGTQQGNRPQFLKELPQPRAPACAQGPSLCPGSPTLTASSPIP